MKDDLLAVAHTQERNAKSVDESSTIEEVTTALNATVNKLERMKDFVDRHFGRDMLFNVISDISYEKRAKEKGRVYANEYDEPEYLSCRKFYTEKMLPLRERVSTLRNILNQKYKEKRIADRQKAEAEERKLVNERATKMQEDVQSALIAIYEQLPKEAYEAGMKEVVAAKEYLSKWEAERAETLEGLLDTLGHTSTLDALDRLQQSHKYGVPGWTS